MRARAALLIIPLLFALLVGPAVGVSGAALGAPDSSGVHAADVSTLQQAPEDADDSEAEDESLRQVLRIELTSDGDAEWTVTTRIHGLETEEDRQAFQEFASDVESGQRDVGYSRETFERFAAEASAATGREMRIRNESWSSEIRNETGYLSYSFTWTNFATVEDDELVLGDAFLTRSGTWLTGLDEGQRLVIAVPDDYAVGSWGITAASDSGFEDGEIQWTGPVTFEPGDIQVTFVDTGGTDGPEPAGSMLRSVALAGGGLLAVVGLVIAGRYALDRRREDVAAALEALPVVGADDETPIAANDGGETESAPAGQLASGADSPTGGDDGTEPDDGDATEPDEAADEQDDEIDPELLSDEERVERLLRRNGGRMKQANIVKETGWSNAKVSQLLSSMDEDDRVDKLRIGRENLISLPDEDVTDVE